MKATIAVALHLGGTSDKVSDYDFVKIWLTAGEGINSHHSTGVIACLQCLDVCLDEMRGKVTIPPHAFATEPLMSEADFDARANEVRRRLSEMGFRSHCSK